MQPAVRLDHSLIALESEHEVHVMLELACPPAPDAACRPPLRIALVLDRSGSMAGRPLDTARASALWLVRRLRPEDRVAVVAYDHEVHLLAPLGPAHAPGPAGALAGLWARGATNLSGGWLRGLDALRDARSDGPARVILLSDGHANQGITDAARLAELAAGARQTGVGTSTVGLGAGFDEELMTAMAERGGGTAHLCETPDDAPGVFASELGGLATLAAQNVVVEVRPGPRVEVVGVMNDHPSLAVPDGVQVEVGDAYAGETRRVTLALRVPRVAALGPATVASLVVRYVAVLNGVAEHTLTVPVLVNVVSAAEAARAVPDAAVTEEVRVLRSARAIREAIERADLGDVAAASAGLAAARSALSAAPLTDDVMGALASLDAAAADLEGGWDAMARKRLHYSSRSSRRRRRPSG
jgi:Ca-activated chloride channel family protein